MPLPAFVVPALIKVGPTTVQILAKLIGRAPRGEYQKFQREALPLMIEQARKRKTPTALFWFRGEIIRVTPEAEFGVVKEGISSVAGYTAWLEEYGKKENIYGLYCTDTLVGCSWRFFGKAVADIPVDPETGKPFQSSIFGSMGAYVIAGLIVGAFYLVWEVTHG